MIADALLLSRSPSTAAWILTLAIGVVLLVWAYRRAPSRGIAAACIALKGIALAALAFCLLEPLWSGQRAKPGANLVAIVADNSQGLRIRDVAATRSRGEQLQDLLAATGGTWQARLADTFELRRHQFDRRLQEVRDFSGLDLAGPASGLGSALRSLRERYKDRPIAGILLLTDGNATDLPNGLPDLAGLPPVYPVVLGNSTPPDVALRQVSISQSAFEDAPVRIQADVVAPGMGSREIAVRLTDEAGAVVETPSITPRDSGEAQTVPLKARPTRAGVSFYRLEATPTGDGGVQEATRANNHRILAVDRGRDSYRILYVAGRPNWEFKFLNRAVQEDPQMQLVGLIRVAKREPKFEFLGRAGESSNPLFRGFGEQSREEVERYDQPVLVRLNTRDELELRAGFPRTAEGLYGYDAVILDDVEAGFFDAEQSLLLQKFVSERGGGFLMLGGAESFQQGGYARTPIGDLLPVYLDRSPEPRTGTAVQFDLSREGWIQAWSRLRDTEGAERDRIGRMPPFSVINPVRDVKPGASVLATITSTNLSSGTPSPQPALVAQRFGRGRAAALMIGDLWRWGMKGAEERQDLDRTWRQLVRWLVSDVPHRVDLTVEPAADRGPGAVDLLVRVRDAQFQPVDTAQVQIEIEPVLGDTTQGATTNVLRLAAESAGNEPGLYRLGFVPRWSGGFRATAFATNAAGAREGVAQAGWSTDLAAEEFQSVTPNRDLLGRLAQATGGEILEPRQLDDWARRLPDHSAPVMEPYTRPAWHTPWGFALALACLLGEWGLRRSHGLP